VTRAAGLLAGVIVTSVPVHGHHSFAPYYAADRTISIEGEIAEFDYRNPHVWVYVLVRERGDEVRKIGAEWINPGGLNQQGVTKGTLRPGDRVIITGSPSRDPAEDKMLLRAIERPADGWKWKGRVD
jgi:hypothetical protein